MREPVYERSLRSHKSYAGITEFKGKAGIKAKEESHPGYTHVVAGCRIRRNRDESAEYTMERVR